MPIYEHQCQSCGYEWEDEYSIKADPPEVCPKCEQKTVKRLISLGGKGVVELTGNDLIEKVKNDASNLKKEASMNEKLYANLLGEDKYQNLQSKIDKKNKMFRRSKRTA
jgi:putative FmdB family regulatory protein